MNILGRQPDFNNMLAVLKCEKPTRPTLFEFFMHDKLYDFLADYSLGSDPTAVERFHQRMIAYANAGYDYVTVLASDFAFPDQNKMPQGAKSISMNHGGMIRDEASFQAYPWPDPQSFDYSRLEILAPLLPSGMKMIVWGPGGVLENVIKIVGYEDLCYLIADDYGLVEKIFDAVGSRLLEYYQMALPYSGVGAIISNDDWGFNTSTMLSGEDMRKLVFPWHRKIVRAAHHFGKPVILHSCGQLEDLMDEIIDDLQYDGKHSYEDNILAVEEAYDRWGSRIAILGGIDLDFVCRAKPEDITQRAKKMLDKAQDKGGYALGSGNSIPDYVPQENYLALIKAAIN